MQACGFFKINNMTAICSFTTLAQLAPVVAACSAMWISLVPGFDAKAVDSNAQKSIKMKWDWDRLKICFENINLDAFDFEMLDLAGNHDYCHTSVQSSIKSSISLL
jgi:hypothetical protein